MKIGLDARLYGTQHGGIGRYIQHLIHELELIDSSNQYYIFLNADNYEAYQPKNSNFKKILADCQVYSWSEQFKLPGILKQYRLDLVHFPHFNVPIGYFGKYLVTIHDLIITHYPTSRATTLNPFWYQIKLFLYRLTVKIAALRAHSIIAVSKYTQQDIAGTLRINPAKIHVIYEGVDLPQPGQAECQAVLNQFRLKGNYLLYVGSAYPHKNLERLLQAFARIQRTNLLLQLVLVGKINFFYQRLQQQIQELGLEKAVVLTDYLPDEKLACLYQNAAIYVFPSLLEGFGLPPLEAQTYGVPVISSNASCLPEILGESAIYFDPTNVDEMVAKITETFDDYALQQTLRTHAKSNLQRFSWRNMATQIHKLYNSI